MHQDWGMNLGVISMESFKKISSLIEYKYEFKKLIWEKNIVTIQNEK